MDLGLKGKRALVLSSSRGIGFGIGAALAAEGASVVLVGRNRERLAASADKINARGQGRASAIVADLARPETIAALLTEAEAALGGVDILVNNSGGPPAKPAVAIERDELKAQFEIMVAALIGVTNHFLPGMRQRRWGRILTVVSSGVVQPIPNLALSNALRLSLVGWSKTLAAEVAADGVTVNLLMPGRIQTERVNEIDQHAAKVAGKSLDAIVAESRSSIPAGRYGTIEEFGAVAAFLASVPAAYVTGTMMRIDGGYVRSI